MYGDVDIYAIIYGGRKLKGIYSIFWFCDMFVYNTATLQLFLQKF